jgi:FPC/CPF motif-containing protein YcgG
VDGIMTPAIATRNPFDTPLALEHSHYCRPEGRRLVMPDGCRAPALTEFVHDGFRALVLNEHFVCVGAKAAVRQSSYRFGLYRGLESPAAAAGLARDLFSFVRERHTFDGAFSTFVASFTGNPPADEAVFERGLWHMLQRLHDLDAPLHAWDPSVDADPVNPRFSFSFGATALFVVGLHPASSRATRRFSWPTLIFNPHDQFEHLRHAGQYARFQDVIRGADITLQGQPNPMLATFGERSEATQYSGRQVDDAWRCPFHPHPHHDSDGEP